MADSSAELELNMASDFTDDEKALIVADLLALKKPQIQEFLARHGLARSGTKEEFRNRIEEALGDGTLSPKQLVQFLDEVVPWGKQHVFLYKGPKSSIANWKKPDWMAKLLKEHRLSTYLNKALALALPEKMKISSIFHDEGRLRITAIKKREWWERHPEYDDTTQTAEGDDVKLHAFVHRVTRSLVAFEWNLIANTAFLQISQLPRKCDYDEVAKEFSELVAAWLDISRFSIVDLRPVIKKVEDLEDAKTAETNSHRNSYRMLSGTTIEAKSPSPTDSIADDADANAAVRIARERGVGHLGNFYWLPRTSSNRNGNPLDSRIHVIIVGLHNRVNFPSPNIEQTVRYVLSRIRSHSA
jgi:hypothetical protein